MVSQEEIRDLIAKAKAKGAIVNVSFDLKARQASAFRPGKDSASAGADSMSA